MNVNVLDLSAYIGLTAVGAMTLNMFLGTLMVFRYSPVRSRHIVSSTISDCTIGVAMLHYVPPRCIP